MTADQRGDAISALSRANAAATSHPAELGLVNYHAAVAQTRAILWLGDLLADLTSAIRESGRNGK